MTESVVFSGLFVFRVCSGGSQGEKKREVSGAHSSRIGEHQPWAMLQMNSPPFPATEKWSRLSTKREGRAGRHWASGAVLPLRTCCRAEKQEECVDSPNSQSPSNPPQSQGLASRTEGSHTPGAWREGLRVFKHSRGGGHQQCQSPETANNLKSKQISLGTRCLVCFQGFEQREAVARCGDVAPLPCSIGLRSPRRLRTAREPVCEGEVNAE